MHPCIEVKHRFQVAALQAWCRQRPGGGLALALASVSVTSYTYYVNYVLCNTDTDTAAVAPCYQPAQ